MKGGWTLKGRMNMKRNQFEVCFFVLFCFLFLSLFCFCFFIVVFCFFLTLSLFSSSSPPEQIHNFGQTPAQLLKKDHGVRVVEEKEKEKEKIFFTRVTKRGGKGGGGASGGGGGALGGGVVVGGGRKVKVLGRKTSQPQAGCPDDQDQQDQHQQEKPKPKPHHHHPQHSKPLPPPPARKQVQISSLFLSRSPILFVGTPNNFIYSTLLWHSGGGGGGGGEGGEVVEEREGEGVVVDKIVAIDGERVASGHLLRRKEVGEGDAGGGIAWIEVDPWLEKRKKRKVGGGGGFSGRKTEEGGEIGRYSLKYRSLFGVLDEGRTLISCGHWDNSFKFTEICDYGEEGEGGGGGEGGDVKEQQSVWWHRGVVGCMGVGREGRWVVTGSEDTTVGVWRVESGRGELWKVGREGGEGGEEGEGEGEGEGGEGGGRGGGGGGRGRRGGEEWGEGGGEGGGGEGGGGEGGGGKRKRKRKRKAKGKGKRKGKEIITSERKSCTCVVWPCRRSGVCVCVWRSGVGGEWGRRWKSLSP